MQRSAEALNKAHLFLLSAVLVVLGLGIFAYKVVVLKFPLVANETNSLWNVEAQVSFIGQAKPAKVRLAIPKNTKRTVVMDESFISYGFGLTTSDEGENRHAIWSIRRGSGQPVLYYRAVVRQLEPEPSKTLSKSPSIDALTLTGAQLAAAQSLLAELSNTTADTNSFVTNLLKHLKRQPPEDNAAVILGKKATELRRVQVAVQILSLASIPARVVQGIFLQEQLKEAKFHPLLEVYEEGSWKYYDPVTVREGIPENYLVWMRGNEPLVELLGGRLPKYQITVSRNEESAINAATVRGELNNPTLLEFSLFSLPLQTQGVYRILLLIPLGALLVVIFRNIIGLKTFGTFMPVLIALAFRETQLLWGIVLFVSIVALGLSVRFYFDHLKLLLVPRLAAMLTVVVLLMATLSVLSNKLGMGQGLSIALFPMVILTMTIERMCITWEELGPTEALSQGIGSLICAATVHLFTTLPHMEHTFFVFPELLLVVLACNLLLGRYTGYRLLELRRFKALAGSAQHALSNRS